MEDATRAKAAVKAVIESNAEAMKAINDIVTGPKSAFSAIQEIIDSPASKVLQETIDKLNALPKFDFKVPDRVYDLPLPLPADERTVAMLQRVRAELEGLAVLTTEGGRQTAAVVEVTKANLTALKTVIAELQESRKSSDRSSRALIWLTVALFVASAVAAVAVAPEVVKELAGAWSQIQPHL